MSTVLRSVLIGSGTCVPRLSRRGPCVLLRSEDSTLAVDLGLGSLHGLLAAGVRHTDLDGLLLTHLHPDHLAELLPLLFAANYDEQPRGKPLTILGGPGTRAYLRGLAALHEHWLEPRGYELLVREVAVGEVWRFGSVVCRAGPAQHIPSSRSYRFDWKGRSLVVTGDTGPCAELVGFAARADALWAEAGQAREEAGTPHLSPEQAGELAAASRVGELVLTHLYPAVESPDPVARAGTRFRGRVTLGTDGLERTWEGRDQPG